MPALSAASRARQKAVPVVASVRCGNSGTTITGPSFWSARRCISEWSDGSPYRYAELTVNAPLARERTAWTIRSVATRHGEPASVHTSPYASATRSGRERRTILSRMGRQIQRGRSTTAGSLRNSLRNARTDSGVGASGVPRLTSNKCGRAEGAIAVGADEGINQTISAVGTLHIVSCSYVVL